MRKIRAYHFLPALNTIDVFPDRKSFDCCFEFSQLLKFCLEYANLKVWKYSSRTRQLPVNVIVNGILAPNVSDSKTKSGNGLSEIDILHQS